MFAFVFAIVQRALHRLMPTNILLEAITPIADSGRASRRLWSRCGVARHDSAWLSFLSERNPGRFRSNANRKPTDSKGLDSPG